VRTQDEGYHARGLSGALEVPAAPARPRNPSRDNADEGIHGRLRVCLLKADSQPRIGFRGLRIGVRVRDVHDFMLSE
jgi:hypothetical protein